MLKSSLRDYSDAYMPVKRTVSIAKQTEVNTNNGTQEVVFEN